VILNGTGRAACIQWFVSSAQRRQDLTLASTPVRYAKVFVWFLPLLFSDCKTANQRRPAQSQAVLGHRSAALLHVDNLIFKDLNHNGRLDPYEDWRLSPEVRTAELVSRLKLDDLAGLMVHGSLPGFGPLAALGNRDQYDLEKARQLILEQHVSSFITRLTVAASAFAAQNNRIQEMGESSAFGIPITISSDPRHHFQRVLGASDKDATFSLWPEPLGFASVNDPEMTRHFADIVRREYMAVGIRESLAPQADLATEPRWARANGTFGEDAGIASRMIEAYVAGVQNGASGLNSGSVIAVVKHWAGYGAAKNGWDSHNFYGRFASHESNNFDYHLQPFRGAFEAHVAAVMPTYSVLQGATIEGNPWSKWALGSTVNSFRSCCAASTDFVA
jgi:beta-glucosidase